MDSGSGIVTARRDRDCEPAFADEAREIVDMAVGMVAEQPLAEPQQPLDAERLVQPHGDILAGQRRVWGRVEQAFLGGDSESRSEERRVGKEWGVTWRSRRSPEPK